MAEHPEAASSMSDMTMVTEGPATSTSSDAYRPPRGKKRNKPTLNCLECVDRKSKCDRVRPSCLMCIRRQTHCQYTRIAEVLAATSAAAASTKSTSRKRRKTQASSQSEQPGSRRASEVIAFSPPRDFIAAAGDHHDNEQLAELEQSLANNVSLDFVDPGNQFAYAIETFAPMVIPSPSSSRPVERHALLNLFGSTSAEHPFQNYWTDMGGLVEVVASLPSKLDADMLTERFFSTVDPIYPIVPRDAFIADVEYFWRLSDHDKHRHDPAQVALQFAVYANAAQDASFQDGLQTQQDVATFYLSCCYQSLCISNYLNRCSLLTVQTIILICHFMIASDRIADAWSISGIAQRQIYGLKLNRNPEDLGMDINDDVVQIRLRLWQAAMLQDALLSLSLKRPPSTTFFNASHLSLRPLQSAAPHDIFDVAYVRAMWQCSALVQETICVPRSSQQPLAVDAAHKSQIITRFREMYAQFEEPFCQTAPTRFDDLPPRLLYQLVTVASHYFHALMLLCIEANEKTGLQSDPYGAISAAHEGMKAFFALVKLSPGHIRVWAAVHNRTYAMAAVIGTMLSLPKKPSNTAQRSIADDPQLMLGKSDLDRYVSMLSRAHGSAEFRAIQRARLANLKALQAAVQDG